MVAVRFYVERMYTKKYVKARILKALVLKVNYLYIIKTEVSLCFMYSWMRLENVKL